MNAGWVEDALWRRFRFNPCVAVHGMRMRVRGRRLWGLLLLFPVLAAVVICATMMVDVKTQGLVPWRDPGRSGWGRLPFAVLSYVQLTVLVLMLPAMSAGAVGVERDKRTLESLRTTLLSPSDFMTGKLLVVLAFGVILVGTSLPVAALCVPLGGIGARDLFFVYTFLATIAIWLAALGLFFSAVVKNYVGAIVLTYLILWQLGGVWPYFALAALLGSLNVNDFLGLTSVTSRWTITDSQAFAWFVVTGVFLGSGCLLWWLAVKVFRRWTAVAA